MLKRLLLLFSFVTTISQFSFADPGIGIVIDSKGNVYYTDLKQVWMIKPDGSKTVAVHNVHTHELYIDQQDRLYGEHLWYNGEQLNTWGHYIWRRNTDGSFLKIKDSTAGFTEWYSFTRDVQGNQYYLEKSIPANFWKIDTAGNKTLIGSKSFAGIGRLHVNTKGILFFSNKADVYCIPPEDSVELFVENVGEAGLPGSEDAHTIWNIWSDSKKNVYLATGNVIKKVDNRRLVEPIYRSAEGWFPVSGLIAPNGDFWVMEYNKANEVRVNKISIEERKEIVRSQAWKMYGIPFLLTALSVVGLYFLFRRKKTV